ncbi:hypothetical protein Lal_00024438 [Lupinus albus]|nr:hypothetical protein Lal_00024438 [Lupinus albus]
MGDINLLQGNFPNNEDLNIKSCIGMEFDSIENVREFYNFFAKNKGQHKVKSGANEEAEDNVSQTKRKCSTLRTGCQASLVVARGTVESNWVITSFVNDHNHIMVSPRSVSYMRCHKKMSVAAKSLVERFEEEGLPTGKVVAIFNNGESSFSHRDCWNHVRNLRRKNLDAGDAQAVFDYCKLKETENPKFFYAIQLDDDSRMMRRDGPRHILVIFQAKGVVQIPDHFILKRWTKEANKGIEASYIENNFDAEFTTSKIVRRMHAQQQASILVDLAEESEMYKFIISELSNTHKSAIIMKTSSLIVLESSHTIVNETVIPEEVTEAPHLIIGDPHISRTKGRRKDGEKITQNCRFKSGLEVSLIKSSIKRKKCTKCGEHGHNKKTCRKMFCV